MNNKGASVQAFSPDPSFSASCNTRTSVHPTGTTNVASFCLLLLIIEAFTVWEVVAKKTPNLSKSLDHRKTSVYFALGINEKWPIYFKSFLQIRKMLNGR